MTAAPTQRRRLDAAYDVAISADSRLLATTSTRSVRLLDLATGKRLASVAVTHPSSVGFSPQSDRLVVATTDDEQHFYAVPDLTPAAPFAPTPRAAATPDFAPDSAIFCRATASTGLVAGHSGHVVGVWDAAGHELARREILAPSTFPAVVWSPDGAELLAVAEHGVQAFTPDLEPRWHFPLRYACAAAYASDGTTLVLGSWERGAILDRG